MRRWVWLAIILAIGLAVYAVVGDVHEVGAHFGELAWPAFGLAVGLSLANYGLRLVRWELYLRAIDARAPRGSSALVFGAGLSLSVTPGKVGELAKSLLLRDLHGIPAARTAPVVVAERVTDLIGMLGLAVIGVAAYGVHPAAVLAATGVLAAGLVILAWPRPARALIRWATAARPLRRLRAPLLEVYRGLAELCRPRLLIPATALAIPAWAAEGLGFAAIVNGLPGAEVGVGLAMVIYAATTIVGALSFLPGGLGATEGAMILLLVQSAAALDRSTAIDATILTRLATLGLAVALGLGCLAVVRRRIAAARSAATSPTAPPSPDAAPPRP